MRALAAILESFEAPLALREIEIPPLRDGQVLVEVAAAGVCGSDVHMWRGLDPRTPLPIILGHEGAGRVVETCGPRADIHGDPVSPGDRIVWERGVTCGACHACAVLGEPSLCSSRWAYGIHRSSQESPFLNGCYATHIVLDARTHLIPLQAEEDPAHFVAACCSGATAAHALDLAPVTVGDTVVILGPGPLGAFAAALARAAGAERVIVIGGTPERLALCARLGATHTLDRHAATAAQRLEIVRELTHGRGADLVLEASGSVAAASEALDLVRVGGSLALVGFGTPVGPMSLEPFEQIVRRNVRVQGVWVSDVRHTLRAISVVRQHREALAELVTHRFALQEATAALQAVEARDAAKVVLEPSVA
jgi:threonine dehydrogenase-like Zn-dependent dehydrogenase